MDKDPRSKLLGDLVHSMKNILGGIGGFVSLIDRDFAEDDPQKKLSRRVQDHVIKLNDMLIDIMYLVRDYQPDQEEIAVHPFLQSIVDSELPEDQPVSVLSTCAKPPRTKSDQQLLRKCFEHAVRLISLVSTQVESVEIAPHNNNSFTILFKTSYEGQNDLIKELKEKSWQQIDSIDFRLSMAILQKLTDLLNIMMQIEFGNPDSFILHLDLNLV